MSDERKNMRELGWKLAGGDTWHELPGGWRLRLDGWVESPDGWKAQKPLLVTDWVVWDRPEAIPKRVQAKVLSILKREAGRS